MLQLRKLDGVRYVGDSESMIVHDSADEECEGCVLSDVLARNAAVRFEPDTLEQAFDEGFDYCDHCIAPCNSRTSARVRQRT
jgi:hypothetical protein